MLSRIDWFLFMTGWDDHFQGVHQVILPKITLDHFTVLLQAKEAPSARGPFKFENIWLEVEGFCDLLKSFWESSMCLAFQVLSWQRSLIFLSLDSKSGIRKSLAILTLRWLIWWIRLSFSMNRNNKCPFL